MTEPVRQKDFVQDLEKYLTHLLEQGNPHAGKRLLQNTPRRTRQKVDKKIKALTYTTKKPLTGKTDAPIPTLKQFREYAETLAQDYATGRVPTVPQDKVKARAYGRLARKAKVAAGGLA